MKMTPMERRQRRVNKRRARNKMHNCVLMFLTVIMAGLYISCLCCEPTIKTLPFFCLSILWIYLICEANGWTGFKDGEEYECSR